MSDWDKIFAVTRHTESRNRDRDPKTGKVLRSPAGAMGRMQVMPSTARDPGHGIRPWNGRDLDDLARVGEQLLRALARKYNGDMAKAWAAYNWGEGRVDKLVRRFGSNWFQGPMPKETRNYVRQNMGMLGGAIPSGGDTRRAQTPTLSRSDPSYWLGGLTPAPSRATPDYWLGIEGSAKDRLITTPTPKSGPDRSNPDYWLSPPTTRTTPSL